MGTCAAPFGELRWPERRLLPWLAQELTRVFSFHHYDNLRHMTQKKDPRRQKYETKGLKVVNLLFSAASGDVTAMRRYAAQAARLLSVLLVKLLLRHKKGCRGL